MVGRTWEKGTVKTDGLLGDGATHSVKPQSIHPRTVLVLRELDTPLPTVFVGFIFPGGNNPLLHRQRFRLREECCGKLFYLEKVVIGLWGQG